MCGDGVLSLLPRSTGSCAAVLLSLLASAHLLGQRFHILEHGVLIRDILGSWRSVELAAVHQPHAKLPAAGESKLVVSNANK